MYKLTEPIEAIQISAEGAALAGTIDFRTGDSIIIERQGNPGVGGLLGWEGRWLTSYHERDWPTETETIFQAQLTDGSPARYVTLNLPRLVEVGATVNPAVA